MIDGLYYGMFTPGQNVPAPLVDMHIYLELMDWVYAARVFRDTLTPNKLSDMVEQAASQSPEGADLRNALSAFATAVEAAMPIEISSTARSLLGRLSKPLPNVLADKVLLPDELFGAVGDLASSFATSDKDFEAEELTLEKLKSQERLIDRLLAAGRVTQAVGVMREWLILMVIYHSKERSAWRTMSVKDRAEKARFVSYDMFRKVDEIKKIRNYLYHHGVADPTIDMATIPSAVKSHWKFFKQKADSPRDWATNL